MKNLCMQVLPRLQGQPSHAEFLTALATAWSRHEAMQKWMIRAFAYLDRYRYFHSHLLRKPWMEGLGCGCGFARLPDAERPCHHCYRLRAPG